MFLALVDLTARTHASCDQAQGGAQTAVAGQRFHERPSRITYHLGQFDQAALRIVPGEEHDEPVLQHHPDQLGIQFTQHPPRIGRVPLIHLTVLFPQFVQQLHLPAFAQLH